MTSSYTLQFRIAHITDAKNISELIIFLSPPFFVAADGRGAEHFLEGVSLEAETKYLNDPRYHFIVAHDAEKLVGFIAMRDVTHLFHLFVAPSYQGRGLGRQLWQQAHHYAITHPTCNNAEPIFTVNSSLQAAPVYQRFGFIESGAVVQTHGISFVPMQRQLIHFDR